MQQPFTTPSAFIKLPQAIHPQISRQNLESRNDQRNLSNDDDQMLIQK